MPNITISMDEKLLKSGRQYAQKNQTSVNAMVRQLLKKTVESDAGQWIEECFSLMDRADANSRGRHWKREDLYDV